MDSAFVSQIVENHSISDFLFSCLTPVNLFRFSLTCRPIHDATKAYMRRAFEINRHLQRFFTDPLAFRALQARTGSVISGSNALQFLDRTFYPESDLDIYIYRSQLLIDWLRDAGYKFTANKVQERDLDSAVAASSARRSFEVLTDDQDGPDAFYQAMQDVHEVFTFLKKTEQEVLKVQIMVARHTPFAVIVNFHSTCVMNFITYKSAHSIFPRATFEDRVSLVVGSDLPSRQGVAWAKYESRGWTVLRGLSPDQKEELKASFLPSWRWVGDAISWNLSLNTSGVDLGRMPQNPIACCGFDFGLHYPWQPTLGHHNLLELPDRQTEAVTTTVEHPFVSHPKLRFAYCTPQRSISQILSAQIRGVVKKEGDMRSLRYEGARQRRRMSLPQLEPFPPPEELEYYDWLVPVLLAIIRRQLCLGE